MKYIIMCGGTYGDSPKQLIEVLGERIIDRTIRLLRANGIPAKDIWISSNDERFDGLEAKRVVHQNDYVYGHEERHCWLQAFYPMKEPVTYVFGDVYFSEKAIETIVETKTDSIMFFASAPPFPPVYMKRWAEPMAFKVMDPELFFKKIEECHRYDLEGRFHREAVSWELWQVIKGTPLNRIMFNYTAIRDYSCDVDDKKEARVLEEILRRMNT